MSGARAADAPPSPAPSPTATVSPVVFPAATTTKVVDKYLVPRFEKFQKATAKLADDLDATCSGKPKRLSAARDDFDQTVLAWAEIEFLRFGPMAVTGRPERISFWPDPRGFMQRQLSALIARRDATALEPGALAGKSAAIHGLPALESLLTGKPPITTDDEDGRYRCRLAVAIAKNLQGIAADLVSEWSGDKGWRARMTAPGPDNPTYKSPAEAPAEFARALVTGLQMIQDRQLGPLIAANAGNAPAAAKPPQLPFAAAGLSARFVGAEVGSLKALYETMGLGRNVPEQSLDAALDHHGVGKARARRPRRDRKGAGREGRSRP